MEIDPLQSKKHKRSESGKKTRNVPLLLESSVAPGVGDPNASAVGEDEEGLLAPEEVKRNTWRVALWSMTMGSYH